MFKHIFVIGIACLCLHLAIAQNFAQQCLTAHNNYRAQHDTPPLTLDNNLQSFAQQWADYLASSGNFEHRPNNKYGENIYAMWGGTSITGDVPVKAWYDEIKDYNYNQPGFSPATGHFTQVVWKSSKRLGCALAQNGNKFYVVANYDPPGNYQGQFPANVLPRKGN